MPYKTGGGGKPELYDQDTGQYTDKEKRRRNYSDKIKLRLHYYFGKKDIEVPYPNPVWNDKDYCVLYIKHIKEDGVDHYIDNSKIDYLLTYHEINDKSAFLVGKLGYTNEALNNDIMRNTDFDKMQYSDHNIYGVKVIAPTVLKSNKTNKEYVVTTVWQITRERKLRFITLIPGGETVWNFIYTIKSK